MTDESSTPAARITAADETLESAQRVLDAARSGLKAAETAALKVEDAQRHPIRWLVGLLALAAAVALVVRLVRNEE
jgi:hypothetical protein